MHRRRPLVPAVALAVVLVLTAACSGSTPLRSAPAQDRSRPNIVYVLTDDMSLDDLQYMPHVRELVGDRGMRFTNFFDSNPLCCPARVSILRGQYSHTNGVYSNGGTEGGFAAAKRLNLENATLATAMQEAGYRTGLFGKYLNGYPETAGPDYVPRGWDTWSSSITGSAYSEYSYTLNEDGRSVRYKTGHDDYGTYVYARQARDFMDRSSDEGNPFFAMVSVYAPHEPATPAPEDEKSFTDLKAPRTPNFNEPDNTDKPAFLAKRPLLDDAQIAELDSLYRLRIQSLQAVDREVASIVDHLRDRGVLDNTYLVFSSDNGFHLGSHRMPAGKMTAYEEDVHLPLLVAGPGIAPGSTSDVLAGNIDLAPTFVDIARGTMAYDPDGRSLLPVLRGQAPATWRHSYLLEHRNDAYGPSAGGATTTTLEQDAENGSGPGGARGPDPAGSGEQAAGGPQLEPPDLDQGGGARPGTAAGPSAGDASSSEVVTGSAGAPAAAFGFAPTTTPSPSTSRSAPTSSTPDPSPGSGRQGSPNANRSAFILPRYEGLRIDGYTYVEYADDRAELYDLRADPYELQNIIGSAPPAFVAQLHQRLDELRTCSGAGCRSVEERMIG